MTEEMESWVRRTAGRPFLCDNCDEQVYFAQDFYLMLADGAKYCLDCPPDDVEGDGSIKVWIR